MLGYGLGVTCRCEEGFRLRYRRLNFFLIVVFGLLVAMPRPLVTVARTSSAPTVEESVQQFLDAQPGPLKTYRDGDMSAAEIIKSTCLYYGISPRLILVLLEATSSLLSNPTPPDGALRQPFGGVGPEGFSAQIDWAARELRAGLGPYQRPPTLTFTDATTLTLTLQQAPEGVAVQRFLAKGRDQGAWRAVVERFGQFFQVYFQNVLPQDQQPQPAAREGFLQRPWHSGTQVVHLAYFDHMFPVVDTGQHDNGFVVNYRGRGNLQYDGHDGHDFYFPDQPIGTYILAAAAGVAYARTHRGNGVVIVHPNGYETVYWHLDRFSSIFKGKVDTDQGVAVRAGDLIGSSGKTGFVSGTPHLHFEVRHNGHEVDPYGWYGPGSDPCVGYVGCEASVWLWDESLAGEGDFTPPDAPMRPDRMPPTARIAVDPPDDVLFLARFDESPLQDVGVGVPTLDGAPVYGEAQFGQGMRLPTGVGVSYPITGNLRLDAGTIAFWAQLPETYPPARNGRHYLIAASAHAAEGPVYTGTLALRRDMLGPGGAARWNFWTTPEQGEAGRDDLAVPDTLVSGWHHFAISWSRGARSKSLYIDGALAIAAVGVDVPQDVGEQFELGRFMPGAGASGVMFDDLVIFNRVLIPAEVARVAAAHVPFRAGVVRVANPQVWIDTNALDDAGGIVRVQIGVDGVFRDPQPYAEGYEVLLPATTGTYTVAARFFDRADNSTIVSATVTLATPPQPLMAFEQVTDHGAVVVFSPVDVLAGVEVQASATPDFLGVAWQPLPRRLSWVWALGAPEVVWVRFRDADGLTSAPQALGPALWRAALPLLAF